MTAGLATKQCAWFRSEAGGGHEHGHWPYTRSESLPCLSRRLVPRTEAGGWHQHGRWPSLALHLQSPSRDAWFFARKQAAGTSTGTGPILALSLSRRLVPRSGILSSAHSNENCFVRHLVLILTPPPPTGIIPIHIRQVEFFVDLYHDFHSVLTLVVRKIVSEFSCCVKVRRNW